MDGKGFPGVAFGGERADARAAARGARGTFGPKRGRGIEGSDRAWCGRGPALSALRARVGGFARYGAGSALPVQGLRQDLQRADRYAAVGLAPQGTLAVVRGVAGEGRDGEGLGGAMRCGAFRWRHRFLAAARSDSEVLKGIVEADETYVLESQKGARGLGRKARRRGGKAKKRGLSREQVPVLMAADRSGTTVSAVLPRVDAAALSAALDPVGREGRPAGLRRWRELPTLRRRARGEPRSSQPLDGGTGSGRSARADGEQPPQPVEGLLASPPWHRHPLSGQLPELVPPRRPRPRRQ